MPIDQRTEPKREASGIGAVVRSYRVKAGLTQVDLARRLGVTPSYISRIESGDRGVSLHGLDAIALVVTKSKEARRTFVVAAITERKEPPC